MEVDTGGHRLSCKTEISAASSGKGSANPAGSDFWESGGSRFSSATPRYFHLKSQGSIPS